MFIEPKKTKEKASWLWSIKSVDKIENLKYTKRVEMWLERTEEKSLWYIMDTVL
jgi:hypothetical protein